MKIGIDVSQIQPQKTGIEYYTSELTKILIQNFPAVDFYLYTNKEEFVRHTTVAKNVCVRIVHSEKPNVNWIWKVSRQVKKDAVDFFISPSNFSFGILLPNVIQVVHDLAPVHFPEQLPHSARFKFWLLFRLAAPRWQYIVTNSKFTAKDVIQVRPGLANKIKAIGTGLHEWTKRSFNDREMDMVISKYDIDYPYILSVGTLQPRKNYVRMIEAFSFIRKDYQDLHYIIAGKKGWYFDEIFNSITKLNLEGYVHFLGHTPESDFPVLFDNAKAFVYCSLFEGFGMPAVEAYARRLPVVVSDLDVFRESLDKKAIFTDPRDARSIYGAIKEALQSDKHDLDKEFLEEFSWSSVSKRLMAVLNDLQ